MKKRKWMIMMALLTAGAVFMTACSEKGPEESSPPETEAEREAGEATGSGEETVVSSGFENLEEGAGNGTAEESENPQEPETDEAIRYISAGVLNVRDAGAMDGSVVGKLIKGSRVEILETLTDGDGTPLWHRIPYEHQDGTEGWISAAFVVEDKADLLGPGYADLDFSPQDKPDGYEGNPKRTVNGIYLTAHTAGSAKLDELLALADQTRINSFVINMKDDNGNMLFETEAAARFSPKANAAVTVKDKEAFMDKLKAHDIYTIARIVCFVDPKYVAVHPEAGVVYKDSGAPFYFKQGVQWSSAYNRELWTYVVDVAKEAAEAGFNEIQFDYVRFPTSNGGKKDAYLDYRNEAGESKPLAIQNFLKYARKELDPYGVYISADVFGLVGSVSDDMGIGQYWEAISNVVDYISPMMYPSHYGPGVYGLSVPDAFPYETVERGTRDAVMRNANLETPAVIRPWIQDFTATYVEGHIRYGPEQIKAQIRGLNENGVEGFMLWNPSNRYDAGGLEKQ